MRNLDRALAWFLVVLGCVHNFVAAPLVYDRLSLAALWFIAAGLALWYAGFLNLLRAYADPPGRLLAVFCFLANLSLCVFVLTYAASQGEWAAPQSLALIGSVTILLAISAIAVARSRAMRRQG